MFSIIIPVYNVEKHLDKCLHSVVNQTYKDVEIIVVNDGSTDNSSEIINRYLLSDHRIKVITQKNCGLSAARNSGLELATKEYVMFIDSDDLIADDTCERLAKYIDKDKSDVYIFGLYYVYDHKKDIGGQDLRYEKYKNGKEYMEIALKDGSFRTFANSKLFKNDLLGSKILADSKKIRFINGLLYEDMFFVVQALCKAKSVSVVPEFLYHYVQHESGRITVQYQKKDLDVLKFIDMLRNGYYKTEEINKFIYAVLTFRWVSSCVLYKYIRRYFSNKQAREIIDMVINDENFIDAVRLCAKESEIPQRDKYLAKILNANPFLYKIMVYFLVIVRDIFR